MSPSPWIPCCARTADERGARDAGALLVRRRLEVGLGAPRLGLVIGRQRQLADRGEGLRGGADTRPQGARMTVEAGGVGEGLAQLPDLRLHGQHLGA
jgi:hypothetical protein